MSCPKCSGWMEKTLVYNGVFQEEQQRCLNCGVYVREDKIDPKCSICNHLVCKCRGVKRSKEREREREEVK